MVRDLTKDFPTVVGEAVEIYVLECAAHREQQSAQLRKIGAGRMRLPQVLGAHNLLLGRREIGPHSCGFPALDEVGEAISHIPIRDGALLGLTGPEAYLVAARHALYPCKFSCPSGQDHPALRESS